jgi:hypothetical protein
LLEEEQQPEARSVQEEVPNNELKSVNPFNQFTIKANKTSKQAK